MTSAPRRGRAIPGIVAELAFTLDQEQFTKNIIGMMVELFQTAPDLLEPAEKDATLHEAASVLGFLAPQRRDLLRERAIERELSGEIANDARKKREELARRYIARGGSAND